MNSITELLDLEDADIIISDISIEGSVKTLTLETRPSVRFCPVCGFRLHSKGIRINSYFFNFIIISIHSMVFSKNFI